MRPQLTWPSCSTPERPLATGALHLWRARLDPELSLDAVLNDPHTPRLPDEEQRRARRYLRPHHGALWAQARQTLREVLALYADVPAEALAFSLGLHDKPALPVRHDIAFNLSHSHDWALVGVMRGHYIQLGVDVERCDGARDLQAIAARVFSARERRELADAPTTQDAIARFYATWTQKEAYIKALGLGLSLPLEQFDVDPRGFELLEARHEGALAVDLWQMLGGQLDADYMFAACADHPVENVEAMSWTRSTLSA